MKCQTCGEEMGADSVYCPKCGERVVDDEAQIKSAPLWANDAAAEGKRASKRATGDDADARPGTPKGSADAGQKRTKAADRLKQATAASGALGEEEEIWRGGYSGHAMWGHWLLAGVVTVLLVVGTIMLRGIPIVWIVAAGFLALLWLALVFLLLYRKLSVGYRLTNQRFMHRAGLLKRVMDRIEVIDIDDITFEQGLIERFSGVGTIVITSSDRTHPTLRIPGIARVEQVADAIDATVRKERAARSIQVEAI